MERELLHAQNALREVRMKLDTPEGQMGWSLGPLRDWLLSLVLSYGYIQIAYSKTGKRAAKGGTLAAAARAAVEGVGDPVAQGGFPKFIVDAQEAMVMIDFFQRAAHLGSEDAERDIP